ncbi:MAG TPA: DUF1236 domain-containing protein [Pseudolabrys sp.]|nr:DUF1236 domain-containing protein [Pseudolabrys sp.]
MKLYLRHAAVGAALVIGTAAAHAQTVITRDVVEGPPIVAAPPADTVITREVVPEETIVREPSRVVEEREVITRSAPAHRVVRHRAVRHVTRHVRHAVNLSTTQRRTIYRTIVHERRPVVVGEAVEPAPVIAPTEVDYGVGSVLPDAVPIYALPEDVADEVPTVAPYDYALVNNRVLLVDPDTDVIVGEAYE